MARKKKLGLDYAPQDTDIHSDRKIRRLLNEFGATGYLVYDYVKCLCYKENGYWIKYDDGFCFDVADVLKSGITENSVLEILKGCFRMCLFNSDVFKAFRIITSKGIQERYLEVRKNDRIADDLNVIDGIRYKNDDLSTENEYLSHKEKEKKEKEIKEEETKKFLACVSDWNLFAEKNNRAKVIELTEKRKSKLRKRFSEKNFELQKILIIADGSDFITGDKGGWFSFDWVIESESNYLKIIEGNFNQNGNVKGNNKGQHDYGAVERELEGLLRQTQH